MADKAKEIALEFIGYFHEAWPEDFDAPLRLVSDDCYYQSIVPTTDAITGKAAIKAKWEKIRELYGDQRHDMKASASDGHFVFTERTDWSCIDGKWVSIPLVAVFEVIDDKIVAWREYLDGGNVARQAGLDLTALEHSLNAPPA